MKSKIILSLFILSSCSTSVGYIIDPRGSKEPKELIRDKLECREIVQPLLATKHETILGFIPFCKSKECMKWDRNYDPMKQCLINRGHSVLN